MLKNNKYSMEVNQGMVKGFFNIYQGRSGKIFLMLNNSITELKESQINDLKLDIYELIDFDYDLYRKAYSN